MKDPSAMTVMRTVHHLMRRLDVLRADYQMAQQAQDWHQLDELDVRKESLLQQVARYPVPDAEQEAVLSASVNLLKKAASGAHDEMKKHLQKS